MNRAFILLLLFIISAPASTQPVIQPLAGSEQIRFENFTVLPDKGYDFKRIQTDSALNFKPDSALSSGYAYWLKIQVINPYPTAKAYTIRVFPGLKNTFYFFDPTAQKWLSRQSGLLSYQPSRLLGIEQIEMQPKTNNLLYFKIDLTSATKTSQKLKPTLLFIPQTIDQRHEQQIQTALITAMIVLLVFFVNNLYVYLSFKDVAILYYLIGQLGGMLYIASYRWYFHIYFPSPVFNFRLGSVLEFYDINKLLMHVAIIFTFFGFVHFTRSFLKTPATLPGCDKALRYSLNFYIILSVIAAIVNLGGWNFEGITLIYDNAYCLFLILIIIFTCIKGFLSKLPAAGSFLMANLLTLLFMLGIPIYHMFISLSGDEKFWLPELAAIAQALAFSIALVARTKTIQNQLKASELNNNKLTFDLREIAYRNQLNEMEIQKVQTEIESEKTQNELLKQRMQVNQRELASSTLYMVQKNELLTQLKTQVQDMNRANRDGVPKELKNIESLLTDNLQLDKDWHKFKIHFEQVHPDFFENLTAKHPTLTARETRIYAYFYIKLSTKEIAALLGIDPASVRRAKTRLYKKMAISDTDQDE
ncbi:7TM diverse intracellular signaling domain-containing protein [Dyadobacter psychrotolerans]|uniref:7TM-DISM receptor extracellular domain-containing protein n=1 Tax=Dyadobacter psychrotolerans TaxID=2541721 RepID=A0A4R5DFV8_9BACT|nr:7TM diverse intracellular signaling domain-containing protein [Dyadobacter psychrotolerans]TDE10840.1 hypothetical protein E0F88_27595 [Dyadobacter psychrotolerans]